MKNLAFAVALVAVADVSGAWRYRWPALVPEVAEHSCEPTRRVALDENLAVEVACGEGGEANRAAERVGRDLHDVEPLHRVQRVEDVHAWRGVRMEREGRGRRESRGEGVQLGATRRVRYALASGRLGYARRGPVSGKRILHGSGGDFDRGSVAVSGE